MLNRAWPQLGKLGDRSNMDFQGYVGSLGKRRQAGDPHFSMNTRLICAGYRNAGIGLNEAARTVDCGAGYP